MIFAIFYVFEQFFGKNFHSKHRAEKGEAL